jgi:hypothetical protein
MGGEWWIGKDVEESGRGLINGLSRPGGTEKKQKNSARIAGLPAEIWTRYLPNTKQEC